MTLHISVRRGVFPEQIWICHIRFISMDNSLSYPEKTDICRLFRCLNWQFGNKERELIEGVRHTPSFLCADHYTPKSAVTGSDQRCVNP